MKTLIASFMLLCIPLALPAALELDFKDNGDISISDVASGAVSGGFSLTEKTFGKVAETIMREDFTGEPSRWEACAAGQKDPNADCAFIEEGGRKFVRAGGKGRYGHGVQPSQILKVKPHGVCEISFSARVPDNDSTFIVYLKLYDSEWREITDKVAPPAGWEYSPYSKTCCRYPISIETANKWVTERLLCIVGGKVHGLRFSICQWRGTHVDCGGYSVKCTGGASSRKVVFDERRQIVQPDGSVRGLMRSRESGLVLSSEWRRGGHGEWNVHAEVEDERKPPAPRALDLEFRLPIACVGGKWHGQWRESRTIGEGDVLSLPVLHVSGHRVAPYPFTSIEKDNVKVALGTPFDKPAFEDRIVDADGIASTTAIGLLPRDGNGGRAFVDLVVFAFDGTWGNRSAMKQYYAIYGDMFKPRTNPREEGLWLWPTWPNALPERPEEFGLAFWEAPATINDRAAIEKGHAHGIRAFPYTEAWGMRQQIGLKPGTDELVDIVDRIAELKAWAAAPKEGAIWTDAPRHIAAQAALNSFPVQPDGTYPFTTDKYDVWFHWWRTNSDPRLPTPNRASICWDYTIGKNIDLVDGVYLDSLAYETSAKFINVRPEHLAVMTESLIYDSATGAPCASGLQHLSAFVRWIAERLHDKGKLVFGNVYGIAQRFNGPHVDIFGGEIGHWGVRPPKTPEEDGDCMMKRFYAYHRPVCGLLQEGNFSKPAPELTAEQMRDYLEHQLFYGFYPGVSTIGGEEKAGYANWKRYYGQARQCERDRELFKTIVPLVRRLNAAGWEPETMAACDNPSVMLERFGDGRGRMLTVRNESDADIAEVELSIGNGASDISCLYGGVSPKKVGIGKWRLPLGARRTVVLAAPAAQTSE